MRPKPEICLTPADQRAVSLWSRGVLAAVALVFASLLLVPQLYATAVNGQHGRASSNGAKACTPWDDNARAALATLAQSGRDEDLSQVADAVFRIRRARRNCQMGWTTLACRDYDSVIKGTSDHSRKFANALSSC